MSKFYHSAPSNSNAFSKQDHRREEEMWTWAEVLQLANRELCLLRVSNMESLKFESGVGASDDMFNVHWLYLWQFHLYEDEIIIFYPSLTKDNIQRNKNWTVKEFVTTFYENEINACDNVKCDLDSILYWTSLTTLFVLSKTLCLISFVALFIMTSAQSKTYIPFSDDPSHRIPLQIYFIICFRLFLFQSPLFCITASVDNIQSFGH